MFNSVSQSPAFGAKYSIRCADAITRLGGISYAVKKSGIQVSYIDSPFYSTKSDSLLYSVYAPDPDKKLLYALQEAFFPKNVFTSSDLEEE